jgi:transcriptional regulator with XRE-family HTH domain
MSAQAPDPGDWLRDQMERKQLTTRDVAEAVGLRDQAVYYWLTGRTAPKDEAASKLAGLLDVPEVEVRRRFGLWVPSDTGTEAQPSSEDLDAVEEMLRTALAELNRLKHKRTG